MHQKLTLFLKQGASLRPHSPLTNPALQTQTPSAVCSFYRQCGRAVTRPCSATWLIPIGPAARAPFKGGAGRGALPADSGTGLVGGSTAAATPEAGAQIPPTARLRSLSTSATVLKTEVF